MASGRLIDYLGADLIANRDPAPDLHPNTLGIFYATDTDTLSIWDGTAWSDVVGSGTVNTVVAGTGIDVDSTNPANPEVALDSASVISLALADSSVQSVVAGTGVSVDNTDPQNPVVSASGGGSGDVVGPASSVADHVALFDGATGKLLKDGGKTIAEIKQIEQNSQSGAYTLVLSDAGKHILHPSADTTARIFTIPANSSVAYPVGTAITIVNQNAAGVVTIAITSDTMRLAGAGTTGSRTLAANGVATALKITSTEWIISGTGLT